MKRVLRLVFSLTLLGSLAISQLPSIGNCQMMYGSAFAKSCSMPCCTRLRQGYGRVSVIALATADKMNVPMSKCPMMKKAPPRDLIISTVRSFKISIQPLHLEKVISLTAPRELIKWAETSAQTLIVFLSGPTPSVRAPPSDIHLENA